MQVIVAPIGIGDSGPQVANLQDALRLMLDRPGSFRSFDSPNRPTSEELVKLAKQLVEEDRVRSVYGEATRTLIRYFQLQEGLGDNLDGAVEPKTAERLNKVLTGLGAFDATSRPVVRGTVRDADGNAVPGVVVRAFDRDLRRYELLNRDVTHTDEAGRYEIPYLPTRYAGAEAGGPDLEIQVFDTDALDRMLAKSDVVFNAGREATIDLTIPSSIDRPSEFDTYRARVLELLKGQAEAGGDLAIVDLNDADIEFLGAESGIDKLHLGSLRAAHQVGATLKAELAAAACYGWFRKGVDARIEAIRARSPGELRQLLLSAIDELIVPASLRPAVETILESVGHTDWAAVKGILTHIGLPEGQVRSVAQRLDSVAAIDGVTLRGFVESGVLKEEHADRLGLAASIFRLTDAGAPAVDHALRQSYESLGNRRLNKSEDLARLTRRDWHNVLKESGAPVPEGSSLEALAAQLEETCVGAYPTIGMIQRAVRAQPDGHGAMLATVVARNPTVDLLSLDLTMDSADVAKLDLGDLGDVERKGVMTQLRTMQRVLVVAEHPTRAQKLFDAGYHTATRITLTTQAELMAKAKISERHAIQVLDRARTSSLQAVHAWMAVRDAQADRQMINGAGTSSYAATATSQLARWADMFGSADFCDCDHCQSVLGPGAYFVDLMHYVERFILDPSAGVSAQMRLRTRREGLWTDKLISCTSTDEVVPTLDIVNKLLETWISKQKPQWTSSQAIYRGIADPASSGVGFGLPINFPLDRLEILLAHFGLTRDRIVQVLGGTGSTRFRSRLRTWPSELALIQDARADDVTAGPYFEVLYRTSRNLPNGPGRLDQVTDTFSVSELQVATELDRDALRMLVRSRFVSRDGSAVPAVGVTLTAAPGAIQNTTESVSNLTRRRLDRLHRLVRLWRKLPWTAPELDYALMRVATGNVPATLNDSALSAIVDLFDLADSTGLAFEEVMALWDELPREGFRGKASLFDRRFNAEPFRAGSGAWPAAMPPDLPLPVTATSTAATDSRAARLLSALRMNEADFAELIESLKDIEVPDPINPVRLVTLTGAVPTSLRLSVSTLPVLYRHALLCRLHKVKPAELLRLVRLTPEIASRATTAQPPDRQSVTSLADVLSLQKFTTWQRSSGFSSEDLVWLIDATRRPDPEPDPAEAATRAIERIAADRLVVFPPTVLTAAGFTEAQSREVVASLDGSAVERTVVTPAPSAGAAGYVASAPQEVDYRVKSGLTDAALDGFVSTAVAPWEFDIAQTAVFGLARQLATFDNSAFTKLLLTQSQSQDLVQRNLDDGVAANRRRPFVGVTTGGVTRYQLNAEYFSATQPAALAFPTNPAGNPINLAGIVVLGFLKQKAQETAQPQASSARAVPETLFTELFLSEQQSRWLVALNPVVLPNAANAAQAGRAFLPNPAGQGTLLNVSDIENATQPPVLSDTLSAVRRDVAALLRTFDPLKVVDRVIAVELGMLPDVVTALHAVPLGVFPGVTSGIEVIDAAEVFGDRIPATKLAALVGQLQRLKRLFNSTRFDAAAVSFILQKWSTVFTGLAGAAIDIERLKAVAAYARWLNLPAQAPSDAADVKKHEALRAALNQLADATGATALSDPQWNGSIATVLGATEAEVRSLKECTPLWNGQRRWHEQLDLASIALELTRRLGVGGRTLARIGGFDSAADPLDDLSKAADDIYGAFRAKYADEGTYREKSEAFEDLIRGKRRDALVAYISANTAGLPLQTSSEMYAYFLMDVEAGGCARTSRLVAAISSVQLFVHRVLMGLEPARFGPSLDAQGARDQWYWRKNYRVWEANRKVFLFPENFIEPDLRDDKTPLFRSLEDELQQRRITTAEAEESYRNYLTGYSEVAGLKIVGAFHDVAIGRDLGIESDDIYIDVLHLVGVTADDPPIHYLRKVGNLKRSRLDAAKYPVQFAAWEKLSTQMPVRWVSPVVHYRKLRLFWNEITTVSTSRRLKEGTYFDGYKHRFKVKWIEQKSSGGWTAPQEVTFLDPGDVVTRAYADYLTFTLSPDEPSTVTRRKTGPNAAPGGEDQAFSIPLPQHGEALPVLEQGQSEASTTVLLGTVETPRFTGSNEIVNEPVSEDVVFRAAPRTQSHSWSSMRHHGAAEDDFTITGWNWERVFPTVRYVGPGREDDELLIAAMNSEFYGFIREPDRRVLRNPSTGPLAAHVKGGFVVSAFGIADDSGSSLAAGHHHWVASLLLRGVLPPSGSVATQLTFGARIADAVVVNARAQTTIPSSGLNPFRPSCIVESGNLQALLINDAARHRFVNLSTSTAPALVRRLATSSVPGLFDRTFQRDLKENLTSVTLANGVESARATTFDFGGAYGAYLRETFFHIPFLVANHLNSQQRFEDSQRWYHYIFNPMAQDGSGSWRYREFVNRPVESLREAMTNSAALAAYRNDPFNPHAIARLRLSAYQKAIVMKYIDNLLDWGDRLFSQFTMESVNEATMLYVLAADILGERPNRLPKCREDEERSYNEIKPSLNDVSDLLIEEMEQLTIIVPKGAGATILVDQTARGTPQISRLAATADFGTGGGVPIPGADRDLAPLPGSGGAGVGTRTEAGFWSSSIGRPLPELYQGDAGQPGSGFTMLGTDSVRFTTPPIDFEGGGPGGGGIFGGGNLGEIELDPTGLIPGRGIDLDIKYTLHDAPPPHRQVFEPVPPKYNPTELVPARSIFCFPVNKELLGYHDRVQDRLAKIRNCMDIAGVRRRLALFAPEIDPRLLVRMKAAGLSLDDVLDSTSGHAPPYRFTFLIERARQYASTVQSLGAQLLSVMEKRDGEELAVLRTVHEQHLLDLRSQSMQMEIDAANDALAGLQRQKEGVQLRQQHFDSLVEGGLLPSERSQQEFGNIASGLGMAAGTLELAAAVAGLLPQVAIGIAAAVSTGGLSVSNVLERAASAARAGATIADWGSKAAGTQASFDRRAQDWKFQASVARKDVAQLAKQIEAAEIRVAIAERAMEVHQKSIEQAREIYDFYRSKFSSFGLYTWLSTQLHRYYRSAFDTAWNMARMTEKALHFERPELRETVLLGIPPWSADRAGLLAGESLLLDLQRLEANYLLTNTRQVETEQSFSLALYYPDKLIDLRQTGECHFDIPEFLFDLSYPGHYFRRIKAVRLSMPCVIGPHTSVGATLRMTSSRLRDAPDASQALTEVPLRHAPSIAVSTAQGDAGVFEFSFRDERLLPFEGMGAISSWSLRLPKQVRAFQYETISDVIVRISYSAREDDGLRDVIDTTTGAIFTRLRDAAPEVAISLRRDFPGVWAKFKEAPAVGGRYVAEMSLTELNYPWWIRGRLAAEEDVAVHVLFDKRDDSRTVDAQVDAGTKKTLEKTPEPPPEYGVHWSFSFAAGKSNANGEITSRTLSVSFNRKDMSEVFLVLGPQATP